MTNQLTGNFIATDQGLSVGGFAIAELCAANQDRGPFYLYDGAWVDAQYEALDKAFKATYPHGHQISYAVKANDAMAILKRLAAAGAGADIRSDKLCNRVGPHSIVRTASDSIIYEP